MTGTTHANCEPHARSVGSRKENDRPGHLEPSLAGPDPDVNETRSRIRQFESSSTVAGEQPRAPGTLIAQPVLLDRIRQAPYVLSALAIVEQRHPESRA